jgi:hypothetical protein
MDWHGLIPKAIMYNTGFHVSLKALNKGRTFTDMEVERLLE